MGNVSICPPGQHPQGELSSTFTREDTFLKQMAEPLPYDLLSFLGLTWHEDLELAGHKWIPRWTKGNELAKLNELLRSQSSQKDGRQPGKKGVIFTKQPVPTPRGQPQGGAGNMA